VKSVIKYLFHSDNLQKYKKFGMVIGPNVQILCETFLCFRYYKHEDGMKV
jgi:hypothetical protein